MTEEIDTVSRQTTELNFVLKRRPERPGSTFPRRLLDLATDLAHSLNETALKLGRFQRGRKHTLITMHSSQSDITGITSLNTIS